MALQEKEIFLKGLKFMRRSAQGNRRAFFSVREKKKWKKCMEQVEKSYGNPSEFIIEYSYQMKNEKNSTKKL